MEASEDDGAIWAELWDRSDDPDSSPVADRRCQDPAEAVQFIRDWLFPL